jgi:hypothetical protein
MFIVAREIMGRDDQSDDRMISVLLALVLFAVAPLGPGLFLLRKVRGNQLRPAEMLVVGVGLSFLIVYGATWTIYLLDAPRAAHTMVSGACLVALVVCIPFLRNLFSSREMRRMLAVWGLFSAFSLALLALVRHHSGGQWGGDWYEHWQRALFFLQHAPLDVKFLGTWTFPSRPPLMNLIEAHVLATAGESYPVYQVVSTLLSALVVLPALLLTRLFTRRRQRTFVLLALFVLNPMLAENATYSWTKLFAAFYVLSGIVFYAAGTRLGSRLRIVLGLVFLAVGVLVHYSAAPYLLFVAGWEAVRAFRKRGRAVGDAAGAAAASGLVLATWFVFSFCVYGVRGTLASTSTAEYSGRFTAGGLVTNVVRNVWWSVVPHALRAVDLSLIAQANPWGWLRDYVFLMYQTNLILGLGVGGALLLFWPRRGASRWRPFWIVFTAVTGVAGIGVVNEVGTFGSAHICLQALVVLGLATAASRWSVLSNGARRLAVVFLAVDFALGIALPFALQSMPMEGVSAFPVHWPDRMPLGLSWTAYANALAKEEWHVTYLGDLVAGARIPVAGLVLAVAAVALVGLWRRAKPSVD